jgi:chemotaxis protein methyltransferase CheR
MLDSTKEYLIESRLSDIAKKEGCASVSALIQKVRGGVTPVLERQIVNAITTNETSFFRDTLQFDALKQVVLPQFIATKPIMPRVRIWSAASSTGQEAYSIAILIRESFPQLASWKIEIVGTDISTNVLERAKSGVFNQLEVNRGLPIHYLMKYFTQSGRDWMIKPEIRQMVDFRHFNLMSDLTVLGIFDIVFCRNVLIYFDIPMKQKILQHIKKMMHGNSSLFLGAAETVFNVVDGFSRLPIAKTVCYQLEKK